VLFEKALFQFLQFFIPQSTTQGPSVHFFLLFFFNWSSKNEIIFFGAQEEKLAGQRGQRRGETKCFLLIFGGWIFVDFLQIFFQGFL